MNVCHICGKDNTMKNGGWLDAYDDVPQAQVGTMLAPITGDDVAKFFDMFSVPQKAVTKMVTGKYQTPSEAMNIKNPVGAFATDMILDPTNLIGAGIVGKAAKASTKSGALSKAYKYNPLAFKPNPEANYRMLGSKGYDDALESGVIRPPETQYSSTNFENAFYNKGYPLDTRFRDLTGRAGYEGPYMAEVKGNTELFVNDNPYGYTGTMFADPVYYSKQNIPIDKEGVKFYKENWLRGYKEVPKSKKKRDGGWLDKFEAPQAENGIEGTMGGLTDEGFNYNGAWGGTMQMGGAMPGAVGFTYARTAGAAPSNGPYAKKTKASAQNGKEMKFYQAGLDFKPKTISQDGSEIPVDSMGYWNPDNVGNPVIIPSNEITMEGVYQPLLGISDTGDTQMMYPGEDYEFDGESVTEYPVAQNGKTLPTIYTENPRDKRLRAYQDSLSLYNKTQQVKNYNYKPLTKDIAKKIGQKYQPNLGYRPREDGQYDVVFIPPVVKPKQEVVKKQEPTQPPVIQKEQPKPIERKQNIYEGSPVYSPGAGSGGPSALIGFLGQKGDTTYIKPEDYERFAVPKYGKEFIESRKKQRNGGVNNADAQPIEKLDQLLNFTNYNKPTKCGWLDKYQ